MGKGSVAAALLAGQVSVDRYNTTRICALCGVMGDGLLVSHTTPNETLRGVDGLGFALCKACAERVALGIIAVFTSSAWGIPLSVEGRALMEAQQRMADAANELHGMLDDATPVGEVRELVRDYLTKPLKLWKAASGAFLATCEKPDPAPRGFEDRRSGVERRVVQVQTGQPERRRSPRRAGE